MKYLVYPWTEKSLSTVMEGLWKSDKPQSIFLTQALREPGHVKFFYYWLKKIDPIKRSVMNLKLNEVTENLTDQMLKEMGVDPQTINYEKGHKFCTFIKMHGFDT